MDNMAELKIKMILITINSKGCTWMRKRFHMYNKHLDKTEGGRIKGGEWGWLEWGGLVKGKWRQLYLNNNKKYEKNIFDNYVLMILKNLFTIKLNLHWITYVLILYSMKSALINSTKLVATIPSENENYFF